MSKTYLNRPATIAAALYALADDFAAMPDTDLPDLAVSVGVQVCQHGAGSDRRAAVVDELAKALLGTAGETQRLSSGSWHHGVPYDLRHRDGLQVDLFAVVDAPLSAVA